MSDPHEQPAPSAPAEEQSLLAQIVDIVRYAPIAILLDGPSMLPKLAEQGKVHMRNARYLGNKAARELEPQAKRLLGALGEQAGELLKLTGLVPETPGDADGAARSARRAPRASVPEPAPDRGNGQRGNGQARRPTTGPTSTSSRSPATTASRPPTC